MTKKQLASVCLLAATIAHGAFAQVQLNLAPTRVLGVPNPNVQNVNPNYVEGREFLEPRGIALDTSVSPPVLYVADTANNRVLAWRNATSGQNGAKADLVIGQRDLTTTVPQGPGVGSLSIGLQSPTGLAVDGAGNLYVADTGNNRVLRFPRPFQQTGVEFITPDIVIGQATFNTRAANGGAGGVTETGLSTIPSGVPVQTGIAVDGAGNLWVTDQNNHRVLRFPASALNRNNAPADLVLGQQNFNTRNTATGGANRIQKGILNFPSGITFDGAGRMFVCDNLSRVLVYFPPFFNGVAAGRIAGVVVTGEGLPPAPTTPVNSVTLGSTGTGTALTPPNGVFMIGSSLAVVDRAANRIVQYPPFEQWPVEASQFSPTMSAVIGQPDFTSFRANGGQTLTTGAGFEIPFVGAGGPGGTEIFVADTVNNRILRLSGAPSFSSPLQVFGQAAFHLDAPNLVEGREFNFGALRTESGLGGVFGDGTGIAFEGNRLYVADTANHRILGFRDIRSLQNGAFADLVIGQDDLSQTVINAPTADPNAPNETGLLFPAGVAVDRNGDLYVADSGNGRVLRFPRPFDQPAGTRQRPNLVLGQAGFTGKFTDATQRNMSRPFGLAFVGDGSLLVSDPNHNRVLYFQRPSGGDFANGQNAALVFGQPDFISTSASTGDPRRLIRPRGIATDTDDRLYVCDTGRSRVVIYNRAPVQGNDPNPAVFITTGQGTAALRNPHGVYVSPTTGEIWVTDTPPPTQVGQVFRYPQFNQLIVNPSSNYRIQTATPIGLAQDQYGNLFIANYFHRISIHYPAAGIRNAANLVANSQRNLAPNTYMSVFRAGPAFSGETVQFSSIPMPTTLADTQVTLNGKPLPLHFVSPDQINALITNDAPTSGEAEVLVLRPSTGQILASTLVTMGQVAPGLFTAASNGDGQVAARNTHDGSINSQSSPAPRGSVVELYGTGLGPVQGAPPDGVPPDGPVSGPMPDQVILGTGPIPADHIQYSGLAPGLVGVWQLNIRIPENVGLTVPAGTPLVLAVQLNSVPNNLLPQRTTLYVRQQ